MMECENPKVLKSGLVVRCGKCPVCLSAKRNEWTIRLAVETKYSERMPLFITLTYDNNHLPFHDPAADDDDVFCVADMGEKTGDPFYNLVFAGFLPVVHRPHVSEFIKAYKRKFELDSYKFHYFGCGEYGDKFGRPHYHILFFGDTELYDLYDKSVDAAKERLESVWTKGNVDVCIADFGGIHYVTKYCLKDVTSYHPDKQKAPFTVGSNNLGCRYFESNECFRLKRRLDYIYRHRHEINDLIGSISMNKSYIKHVLDEFYNIFPRFQIELDDGRIVPLPRYFRKRLIGSFEHFKDSPLWVIQFLERLYQSIDYYEKYGQYDAKSVNPHSSESLLRHIDKINSRFYKSKKPIIKSRRNEGI